MRTNNFLNLIGFNPKPITLKESLLSALGGFLGIFCILLVSYQLLDPDVAVFIIPSLGASAVLLFAAPHAPFSQPWNLVAGHLFSAFIGVACWHWIPDFTIAAAASVGISIGVMYFTRCIHPPGGATALAAVVGSQRLHELGFAYIITPVLLNVITILAIAFMFNGLFKWRRYPARPPSAEQHNKAVAKGYAPIRHEDFVYALSHIDTFVDIDENDLLKIYALATNRHVAQTRS